MQLMPRWAGIIAWTAGALLLHADLPLELSRLDDRAGRTRRPRVALRSAGLLTVAAGGAVMAWAMAAHYQASPKGWALDWRPTREYLLRAGPYRFSRNPMYGAEMVVWLGWALFYGSPAVWAGLALVSAALATAVRWEERQLLERFGDTYRAYLAEVPRWLGGLDT
jgi:protein-S-isoprenylcysteine O-methyltransferase Ste14